MLVWFVLAVVCMATPGLAATQKMKVTLGPGQSETKTHINGFSDGEGRIPEVTVSSSDPEVLEAVTEWDKKNKNLILYGIARKPGTVTVTATWDGDTTKFQVTVLKYINPVKSIVIGNTTIKGKYFNNKDTYRIKWSRVKGKKVRMKVSLKKGWRLSTGDPIYTNKRGKFKAMNMTSFATTLNGGKGSRIGLNLYNVKKKYLSSPRLYIEFY